MFVERVVVVSLGLLKKRAILIVAKVKSWLILKLLGDFSKYL
jgi:hypothetical protein